MSGDTERQVREFCSWWEERGHDATAAEGEKIARELLGSSGRTLTRGDVDAYCGKLKRGFAGGRTILVANEVGDALLEWLASTDGAAVFAAEATHGAPLPPLDDLATGGPPRADPDFDDAPLDDLPRDGWALELDQPAGEPPGGGPPLDELSWGAEAADDLLAGMSADDLPPIPDADALPPLPTTDDAPPLAAPDMSFDGPSVLSLDERVDAIGGRDVFAASDPPPAGLDLQLDIDADMIGGGDKAHYVRAEEMEVGGGSAQLNVDVDPNAPNATTNDVLDLGAAAGFDGDVDVPDGLADGVPHSRAAAAPVGRSTSSEPPTSDFPADENTREDLPALTTPPPPAPSRQPLMIGLALALLLVAAAVATFAF